MRIREVCLDANVFIAALMPNEAGHQVALASIQAIDAAQVDLFEPAIVLFEVGAAIHRKLKNKLITDAEADDALDTLFELPLILQWQVGLLKKATYFTEQLSFQRTYDCTYLAVAASREIPLITFDQELIKKGRKFFKRIYSAQEPFDFAQGKPA